MSALIQTVEPEDLIKYGLIPEFVGRLPVVATLDELDEEQLVKILIEPKNALTKQYERMFDMENCEIEFRDDALRNVARKSMERKTGAAACARSWKTYYWIPCTTCLQRMGLPRW